MSGNTVYSIKIVFNSTNLGTGENLRDFLFANVFGDAVSDEALAEHMFWPSISGPTVPNNMKPEDHPDWGKLHLSFNTDDWQFVSERLRDVLEADFSVVWSSPELEVG